MSNSGQRGETPTSLTSLAPLLLSLSLSFLLFSSSLQLYYHNLESSTNPRINPELGSLSKINTRTLVLRNSAAKKCPSPAAASVFCAPPTGAFRKARDSLRTVCHSMKPCPWPHWALASINPTLQDINRTNGPIPPRATVRNPSPIPTRPRGTSSPRRSRCFPCLHRCSLVHRASHRARLR